MVWFKRDLNMPAKGFGVLEKTMLLKKKEIVFSLNMFQIQNIFNKKQK